MDPRASPRERERERNRVRPEIEQVQEVAAVLVTSAESSATYATKITFNYVICARVNFKNP